MSVALAEDGSCPYDASCPGERRAAVAGTTQHRCWFVWPGNGDRAIVCYHRRRLARQPQKAYMRERKAGMNVKLMCWKRAGTYDVNLLWCINCPMMVRFSIFLNSAMVGVVITCVVFTRRSWTAPPWVLNIIQHPGVIYIYIYIYQNSKYGWLRGRSYLHSSCSTFQPPKASIIATSNPTGMRNILE